jgi:ribonuclease Z
MSIRRFTALGTASQVPNTKRNQHASFLKWDNEGFLFDPGEGTQRQMIFSGISATEITKIFITHFHGDHCLGLASILQRLSLDRVQHTVQIYFPASGCGFFENIKGVASYYDVAFIEARPIDEDGVIYADDNLVITTKRLQHTVETFGYRIEEKDSFNMVQAKLDALGLSGPVVGELKNTGQIINDGEVIRLEDVCVLRKGQSFAFVLDTRMCDAAITLAQGVDLLVTESTFLNQDADKAQAHGHLTALQAGKIAKKADVGMLLLTHFSQRYGPNADFASEARDAHPNVMQMNDKDTYELVRPQISLL